MCFKELLLVACWSLLLGGLRLTSTTTTTTFVAAMSITNPDLERYFRTTNISQPFTTMSEERIAMDLYTYAYLNYSYGDTKVPADEEQARYGEGKILTVHGKLVHISNANDLNDDYACSGNILGTRGNPFPPPGVYWIALVRRGRCTFEEKVKNVYEKGAYGVIIYNDKTVVNLEKMQIKGQSRNITAVITYDYIGLNMALKVDEGHDVYCSIIEGRSGMRPINSLNRFNQKVLQLHRNNFGWFSKFLEYVKKTSVLFVSISFIVLMVISLVWLIFYYIQRFRYLQTKDQQSRQLCSVTKKAIMKIPTKTGKSSDEKDMDSDCCAICIESYKASDCIRVLPCKHEFHKNCIDPWLIEHRTCPMCKLDVLKFYGYVVGDQIYATPSPQHIPPNLAPVDDNDVPVVVVSIPHSTSQQQSQAQAHQQQQQQQTSHQPRQEQGQLLQTTLLPSTSTSPSPSAPVSVSVSTERPQPDSQSNINSSCAIHSHSHTNTNSNSYSQSQSQNQNQSQSQSNNHNHNYSHSRNHSCSISNGSSYGYGYGYGNGNGSGNTNCNCNSHRHQHQNPHQNQNHHVHHGYNRNCRSNCSANSNDNSNQSHNERSSVEPLMSNGQNCCVRNEEMRRNSAPQLTQVSTASHQFIGSEESILEIEAERRSAANTARDDTANVGLNSVIVHQSDTNRENVLNNLIRSRDFVIDFPRIFVLDAGSSTDNSTSPQFSARLPERSQSSLSLAHAKDWMSLMSNKLEEQQGQPRMRKLSARFQMQENLLGIRTESIRNRRSRSADGRYSNGFFGRRELSKQQVLQNDMQNSSTATGNGKAGAITEDLAVLRRNSNAIYELTEASYAESKQKRHSTNNKRENDMEPMTLKDSKTQHERKPGGESGPLTDINITIQINGEDIKLEE